MTLDVLSSTLFSVGVMLIAIGFAAHVGHAVMLANGRRTLPVLVRANQPAYAGVVTGSFVSSQVRAANSGPTTAASPTPLSRAAIWITTAAWIVLGLSLLARGDRGRARAVGQHVRVQRRVRVLDGRRLPLPAAPVPDPLDRLHPDRRRAGAAALRLEPAVRDQAARAGAPERAAADDPRRHGRHRVRDLRDELRGRASRTSSRARATGSRGCRRTRSSTRSPTARSSSASRSSRR